MTEGEKNEEGGGERGGRRGERGEGDGRKSKRKRGRRAGLVSGGHRNRLARVLSSDSLGACARCCDPSTPGFTAQHPILTCLGVPALLSIVGVGVKILSRGAEKELRLEDWASAPDFLFSTTVGAALFLLEPDAKDSLLKLAPVFLGCLALLLLAFITYPRCFSALEARNSAGAFLIPNGWKRFWIQAWLVAFSNALALGLFAWLIWAKGYTP